MRKLNANQYDALSSVVWEMYHPKCGNPVCFDTDHTHASEARLRASLYALERRGLVVLSDGERSDKVASPTVRGIRLALEGPDAQMLRDYCNLPSGSEEA